MKKLKLNKFKIATLNNSSKLMGGNGDGDGVDTVVRVCVDNSKRWIEKPKGGGPIIVSGNNEIDNA